MWHIASSTNWMQQHHSTTLRYRQEIVLRGSVGFGQGSIAFASISSIASAFGGPMRGLTRLKSLITMVREGE